jgi:hypothetical protein
MYDGNNESYRHLFAYESHTHSLYQIIVLFIEGAEKGSRIDASVCAIAFIIFVGW